MPLPERKHRGFYKIGSGCVLFSSLPPLQGSVHKKGPVSCHRGLRVRTEPCPCSTADGGITTPAPVGAASLPGFWWEARLQGRQACSSRGYCWHFASVSVFKKPQGSPATLLKSAR